MSNADLLCSQDHLFFHHSILSNLQDMPVILFGLGRVCEGFMMVIGKSLDKN